MPRYPTPGEYQEALQFPEMAFTDPELKAGEPDVNALGLPQPITGAFAAVFPVNTPLGRYAVKCFLADVPDQQARYRAISKYLDSGKAEAVRSVLVPFEYQPGGVTLDGKAWPILKMGWAEGVTLNRFVARHIEEPETLNSLAENWAVLMAQMEAAAIAHGDLQHGNVLVAQGGGGFRLVDYDTLFVPPLKGRRSPEAGHRNYQHPDRNDRDFGPWLDRFSGLVVYTALRACALDASLWDRYDTGENLLFRAADFYDPAGSPLFSDLAALSEIQGLVNALRTACHLDPDAIPSLSDIRSGVHRTGGMGAAARRARIGLERERRGMSAPRSLPEKLFLPLTLAWLATVTAALPAAAFDAGLLAASGGLGALGLISAYGFGRQALVQRRRRLLKEAAFFERAIGRLREETKRFEAERRKIAGGMDGLRRERLSELRGRALEDRLKHHFVSEVGALPGVPHRMVVRMKLHGIRTAYQATPERLNRLTEVSAQTRARVTAWRADLVERYRADLPELLSPAEEHRLQRSVRQRLDGLHTEEARLREKIAVQEKERAEVLARRAEIPALSYVRYVRYLLRIGRLPPSRMAPPRPVHQPVHGAAPATPPAPTEDTPWWRHPEDA